MTVSLTIVAIILGQIFLALFYFSRPKNKQVVIKKRSNWPRNLKYSIPLLTWLIYLNLFGSDYSFLVKYSKIIFIGLVIFIIILKYLKPSKKRIAE
ncbi:MAG: hypothetical protein CME60_09615 [Halobacteriovoraceae bacterium]|nr:hypothetical protein [Halobacteriovoraceae bacterium]